MASTHCPATAVSPSPPVWRRAVAGLVARVLHWQERAEQRWHLTQMDERMLKDLGIGRGDAWREANKPFWRE